MRYGFKKLASAPGPTGSRGGARRRIMMSGVVRRERRGTRSCPFLRLTDYTARVFACARFSRPCLRTIPRTFSRSPTGGDARSVEDQPLEPPKAEPSPPRPGSPPAPPGDRSLVGLFMMLASFAVVGFGACPGPGHGQRQTDPRPGGRGHRPAGPATREDRGEPVGPESRMLDELIYDLQLRYVQATKPS